MLAKFGESRTAALERFSRDAAPGPTCAEAVDDADEEVLHVLEPRHEVLEGRVGPGVGQAPAEAGNRGAVAVDERDGEDAGQVEVLDEPPLPRRSAFGITAALGMRGSAEGEQHRVELEVKDEAEQIEITMLGPWLSVIGPVESGEVEKPGV